MQANPITFVEIEAWSRLMCVDITPVEVEMIKILDNSYLSTAASLASKNG